MTTIKKIKCWIIDKYYWLLTFNKKPVIKVHAHNITADLGEFKTLFEINGRSTLDIKITGTLSLNTKENIIL